MENTITAKLRTIYYRTDWVLFSAMTALIGAGLITMRSFVDETAFFSQQLLWSALGIAIFFAASCIDFRFLRRTPIVVALFGGVTFLLLILFVLGETLLGAQSWFTFAGISIQPTDPAKLVLVIVLAKYFSRRHVEIAHIRHILVSGAYAFIFFALVFFQPDFGSAIIIGLIWLGMVLVSGISKRHFGAVLLLGVISFAGLWFGGFADYQKERITSFLHPYADLQGSGYNAYQSMVAVGSGQMLGKGIGYGTQSELQFLPEYETDFIFAAFAEEWGFVGAVLFFAVFTVLIWRIISNASRGATNFEVLYGAGIAVYFMSQFAVHIGMNIGLLPVTGVTMPLMSYGGSHLLTECLALGVLMGQRGYMRAAPREDMEKEIEGI